jgi:flagellar hook-length control protein FliK
VGSKVLVRIQLSPDALGGIAVAIRHDAGGTHLHFTAEQAQTATRHGLRGRALVAHRLAHIGPRHAARRDGRVAEPHPLDEAEAGSSATTSPTTPSTRIA